MHRDSIDAFPGAYWTEFAVIKPRYFPIFAQIFNDAAQEHNQSVSNDEVSTPYSDICAEITVVPKGVNVFLPPFLIRLDLMDKKHLSTKRGKQVFNKISDISIRRVSMFFLDRLVSADHDSGKAPQ